MKFHTRSFISPRTNYLKIINNSGYFSQMYVRTYLFPIRYSFLPPATKLEQGYVFTRVCDTVHRGGVSASVHAGIYPLGADTPPPQEQTPPWEQIPPACTEADTTPPEQIPLGAVYTGRYGQQTGGTHPTGMHTC